MRAKHSRFNRVSTIIISAFALIATVCISLVLILSSEKVIDIQSEEDHMYQARFFVDDALVYSNIIKKGDVIGYGYSDFPQKDKDVDGQPYLFIGWDLTGEGFIDILPNRIYGNFDARAVFMKFGIPDIDWTKVDFNRMLDLLTSLNIDLESFMNFFGLDWEDMLELLDIPVIDYDTDYRGVVYLRNESFGDYNQKSHKWNNASFYPLSNVSEGSINPLNYSYDKIKQILPTKANESFSIKPLKEGGNYPVPCYGGEVEKSLNSDSISLTKFEGDSYDVTGMPYSYVNSDVIAALRGVKYSSKVIEQDELKYREYAHENYTKVDDNMKEFISNLLEDNDISYDSTYRFVDKIYKLFKNNYTFKFTMKSYPLTSDPILYFLGESKEGIGRHFAAATTLMFRTLGVPARYVQGYVDNAEDGDNTISAIQAHSWCEIYVDGIGWLAVDPAIHCISQFDSSFLFNTDDDLDFEAPPDGEMDGVELTCDKLEYDLGEEFDMDSLKMIAHYDSGETREVTPSMLIPSKPNMDKVGKQKITAIYYEGDKMFSDTIEIEITSDYIELQTKYYASYLQDTYSGYSLFEEQDLLDSLYFVDLENKIVDLDDINCYIQVEYAFAQGSGVHFVEDIVDAGNYSAAVSVKFMDKDTGVESNLYRCRTKKVNFTVDTLDIYVSSLSKTISYSELDLGPYYGEFYCHELEMFYIDEDGEEIEIYNNDYLDPETVTGWASIFEDTEDDNTYDTDSVRIYRDGRDVTKNYSIVDFYFGTLEVKSDEV